MQNNGYYIQSRREMLAFIPVKARRILEVGCGEGLFCESLRGPDREVWGVELNGAAAAMARARCDHFIEGDFFSALAQLPVQSFDCIVFNDVLEHLPEPWKALNACKDLFTPEGVLVSSIPNFRFVGNLKEIMIEKDFRYKELGILDITHLRFFTSRSILRMHKECGYEVIRHEGIRPCKTFMTEFLILLSFGFFRDIRYKQFATTAKPIRHE